MAGAAGVIGVPITLLSGTIMDRFGRKRRSCRLQSDHDRVRIMVATAALAWPFAVFVVIFLIVQGSLTILQVTAGAGLGTWRLPPPARFFGVWQT